MPEEKFLLVNHIHNILKIAEANRVTPIVALQCFIANLSTKKEHFAGVTNLDYEELGQQWCNLTDDEKATQKTDARAKLM